jgi:tetratricopeptide (TPR) repeat protein
VGTTIRRDEPAISGDRTGSGGDALRPRLGAHQIAERFPDAIDWYERTAELPGDTPIERQIKSFADNNGAWLYMNKCRPVDLARAEELLRRALDRFPNKMAHANLGEIYRRRKHFHRALAEYEQARRLDGRYANALNETAIVYVAMAGERVADGRAAIDPLLAEATKWHRRALDALPPTATHQQKQVRKTFKNALTEFALADAVAVAPE